MACKTLLLLLLTLFVGACGVSEQSITAGQAKVDYDLLYDLPEKKLSFNKTVLPLLEKRCVVCHGCYDAPCQLKLSSAAGVYRGANKAPVYDAGRLKPADPTRLFIDAMSTVDWRKKDFFPVLYEKQAAEQNSPARNLEQSVLYRMLRLKQLNPQARTGMLSDKFDLSLSRSSSCPSIDEFDGYAVKHPEGGMPYAMPNLSRQEYKTLVHWLAQGAPVEAELPPSEKAKQPMQRWEAFLNGGSNKHKLVSRYLYEHLFQAHLHFENTGNREFYRLVRSSTPPGEPVRVIATRRPYGEVNGELYYRLQRYQGSIVAKTHMVYELSDRRMQRFRQLFFDVDYEVKELPSYQPQVASNPIEAFAAIPVKSRYRFLLDDARFFIEGFIKGPVCRGQVALNVIEDQFWVAFFDPEAPIASNDDDFLRANAKDMALPSELEDTFSFLSVSLHYKSLFRQYVKEKEKRINGFKPIELKEAMAYLWKGHGWSVDGGKNRNTALTIFRHLDSASVNYGWLGDYPETAWFIDYSVLERMHYLLVAGFDVYGNAGHQLNTRLYMDVLRTEGEDYFLAFLPPGIREQLYNDWYQGIRASNKNDQGDVQWRGEELVKGYKTNNPQRELYRAVVKTLGLPGDFINRCEEGNCPVPADKKRRRVARAMQKAAKMDGKIVQFLPDLAFVRVRTGDDGSRDMAYTMIYNKAYKNVSNMMQVEKPGDRRDYADDSQTILPWLEGVYPNFFYVVDFKDIETFVEQYNAIGKRQQYEAFVMRFGIRRTNEDFWRHADWFNRRYAQEQPLLWGVYDLNRYQNR